MARGRLTDSSITAVRESARIDKVVAEYVTLKRAGTSLKGLCPFHDEKGPSFHVTPDRGYFHCLAGETGVLTDQGVVPIRALAGRTARVLTSNGQVDFWVDAPFASYGIQPLHKITVTRNGHAKDLYATNEHRWLIRTGRGLRERTERLTQDLKPGDILVTASPPTPDMTTPGTATTQSMTLEPLFADQADTDIGASHHPGVSQGWVVTGVEKSERIEEVFCAYIEGTHSFVLEDDILTGNCFGCGEGGDVIDFVSKIENLDFVEAIERLADRYRVELVYDETTARPGASENDRAESRAARGRLVAAHVAAAEFYAAQLFTPEAIKARRFLSERGFDRHAAAQFGCGYSPNGWDVLIKHLTAQGFTTTELQTAGLTSDGKNGPIDRFRGRLMFPIRDQSGDIIGFGARKLLPDEQDKAPKYLNTPETPIYKKSRVLFGLDAARKSISKERRVVVVEGYTDVMSCHLSGEGTAVATCGTAFGEDHIRIIRRLLGDDGSGGEVIYTFDGDSAGQKAALRAFTMDDHFQTRTSVAVEPDGMDPCEVRMARGPEGVQDLIENRVPLFEFAIKTTLAQFDLRSPEGRANALAEVAPILAGLKHVEMRDGYIRQLSRWTGTEQTTIRHAVLAVNPHRDAVTSTSGASAADRASEVGQGTSAADNVGGPDPFERPDPSTTVFLRDIRDSLKALLQEPKLVQLARSELRRSDFVHPSYKAVWDAIVAADDDSTDKAAWIQDVHRHAASPTLVALITELAVDPYTVHTGLNRDSALATFLGATVEAATYAVDRIERQIDAPGLPDEQYLALLERLTAAKNRHALAMERRNQLLIGG